MSYLSPYLNYTQRSPSFIKIPFSFLPSKVIRGLHRYAFPYIGDHLYITRSQRLNLQKGNPAFLIRIDDFPRLDLDTVVFEKFHDIFLRHNVDYILGVTPFLKFTDARVRPMTDKEVSLLQKLSSDGVELALHGFTHESRLVPHYHQPCETYFYSVEQLQSLMDKANHWFRDHMLQHPLHYIPPFNTFSKRDFEILSKEYKIFHGGPLSLLTFGKYGTSLIGKTDILYLPSFEPYYSRAKNILRILKMNRRHFNHKILYSLTLHWAWEHETSFKYVDELLMVLKKNDWLFKQ